MDQSNEIRLESRRKLTSRAQKNLLGLTESFDGLNVHKTYLNGLDADEFRSGMDALARTLKTMYTGMINEPQLYAMKDPDDVKGLVKNTNFLLLLAQKAILNDGSLEVDGQILGTALKDARVTKPEIYFQILEPLGFTVAGLGKKIEASESIIVSFPDNGFLLTALKAVADAAGAFSPINPNTGNYYFELLDHRALENYPAAEPKLTMEYILTKLSGESREVAGMFYEFIKPLAKCDIKGSIGHYWTPTFTLKSTKKVIMSLKLTLDSHDVKLNLANIGKYTELLEDLPAKMMGEIKDGGWSCGNCGPKCAGGFAFELDGKSYNKCRGGSFLFDRVASDTVTLYKEMLEMELEAC